MRTLFVHKNAEHARRAFNALGTKDDMAVGFGAPLQGRQFDRIIILAWPEGPLDESIEWADHIRCRLTPDGVWKDIS